MWIIKPANENQGRGITVLKTLKDILTYLFGTVVNNLIIEKY